MAISRVFTFLSIALLLLSSSCFAEEEAETEVVEEAEAVLTLDASNFTDVVARHSFIVVEFYAPWCGHCKHLAPEYEKAAKVLSKHDPPIALSKVDAYDEQNKELGSKYEVQGFPTIKILRNQGSDVQDYNGPREADEMVKYLKKQAGPASVGIKSVEDASNLISENKVVIVGVFPEYAGIEFENFMVVANKLRADYDFGHTLDANTLPLGDKAVKGPLIRLFKPFDELFVDSQDLDKDALEKFIEISGTPLVITFDDDDTNRPYLIKYFSNPSPKAMLFLSFSSEKFEAFKNNLYEAAKQYSANNISFLIGDVNATQGAFQFFGLKEDQIPLFFIQDADRKYLKMALEPDEIAPWLKEFFDGNLTPYKKSEPIPEVNSEPVKVVVADSLHDVVFNSGKNVLLEFYAPWCGHCKQLAPILDEVAVSFQNDEDIVIAKMDATANDVPAEFQVDGYPTMYFYSADGKLLSYDGGRTAEDITDFIKKNRATAIKPSAEVEINESEVTIKQVTESESIKDEL